MTRACKAAYAETQLSYRFQLQMPPDLQGQTWIRVSNACASKGLPCRRTSFVRAAPRGFSGRICATLLPGIYDPLGLDEFGLGRRFRARGPTLAST